MDSTGSSQASQATQAIQATQPTQLTQQTPTDGWTLVTRRRRPAHFQPSQHSPPQRTRTLNPHSPTYAQALQSALPPDARTFGLTPTGTNPRSSPQGPAVLPYPPSPHQKEWWGRCFRCTCKGHVAAECSFPRITPMPKQAQTAHPVRPPLRPNPGLPPSQQVHSPQRYHPIPSPAHPQPAQFPPTSQPVLSPPHLQPVISPTHPQQVHSPNHPQPVPFPPLSHSAHQLVQTLPHQLAQTPLFLPFNHLRLSTPEPGIDEFLTAPEPLDHPAMPSNRPLRQQCYFTRDHHYLQTLQKLSRGIVIQPPAPLNGRLSLDHVAQVIATSGKVSTNQLHVAVLTKDRFLVLLSDSLDRDQIVAAIPRRVWDEGYRFHSYSPLTDASVSIPSFKVWLDIHGVPLELGSDAHLMTAVSSFGVFLGSMEPRKHGDYQTCTVFIATDDLSLIPCEIDMKVGGLAYIARICPRKWIQRPVFHRTDLPSMMLSYPPPTAPQAPQPFFTTTPNETQDDDFISVSRKVLQEVFRDFPPSELPPDLAAYLSNVRPPTSASGTPTGTVHRNPPRGDELRSTTSVSAHHAAPNPLHAAVLDQSHPASNSVIPTLHASLSSPGPTPPPPVTTSAPKRATVHRTPPHTARKDNPPPDLALQVCQSSKYSDLPVSNRNIWDPNLLFPELGSSSNKEDTATLMKEQTLPAKDQTLPGPSHQLHRTTKGRISKKANTQSTLEKLDEHAFVDVPLQYDEARILLQSIGAARLSIPPNILTAHPVQKTTQMPLGRSKGRQKIPQPPRAQDDRPGLVLL